MPRRSGNFRRDVGVDEKFGSPIVQKFINIVMERGEKNIARRIVYGAIDEIARKMGNDARRALEVFHKAFEQVAPYVEVRPRRVGGSTYQIPMEVSVHRRQSLSMRWLKDAAIGRPGKTMQLRLASELLDASNGHGGAVKKRTEVQKMAEANRAFSHYAW